jgi:dTDP-4-dehydrorhamnose 3,5-epimerase/CDP-3, 6-dideoxy-D-glycero-D-glycero-4-hexulose-5-epimerase
MKVEGTSIDGVKLIHLNQFTDLRGSFVKVYNEDLFKEMGLQTGFKESYFSVSQKNVIRGMHFQTPPFDHVKLVYVNKGAIVDVVVDIRQKSPTYGQFVHFHINENQPCCVYIESGLAHGFLALEDNTMVTYNQTTGYAPNNDAGIRFDSFGFDWFGAKNPIISDRDLSFPSLSNFNSPF